MKYILLLICFFLQLNSSLAIEEQKLCRFNLLGDFLSHLKWLERGRILHEKILSSMNENKRRYKRLFDNKSPFIKYMQSLGIKFWYNSSNEFQIELPQIASIYRAIEVQANDLVRNGAKPDEVIKPIVVISKGLGKKGVGGTLDDPEFIQAHTRYTAYAFGDRLPRDQEVTNTDANGFIADKAAFYYFLGKGGHPLSNAVPVNPDNGIRQISFFEHELAHYFGMYGQRYSREFQRGFHKIAKEVFKKEQRKFTAIVEASSDTGAIITHGAKIGDDRVEIIGEKQIEVVDTKSVLQRPKRTPQSIRRYYYNEGMVFVKKGMADELRNYFNIPENIWNSDPENIFEEILVLLKKSPVNEIQRKIIGINKDLEKFLPLMEDRQIMRIFLIEILLT